MPSKAALEAMANMANQGPDPLSAETKEVLLGKASAKVEEVVLASSIFDENCEALLSRYEGNGEFAFLSCHKLCLVLDLTCLMY